MGITDVVKYPSDTVGKDILRSDLELIPFGESAWVLHKDKGVLSVLIRHRFFHKLYSPIEFKSVGKAQAWIDSGCIAEIQESCSELDVGFRKEMVVYRENQDGF